MYRQTQTYRHTHRYTHRDGHRHVLMDTQRNKQAQTYRHIQREIQTHTEKAETPRKRDPSGPRGEAS